MKYYKVRYKNSNDWFWKKLERVKGDGIMSENPHIRFFILEDESRVEVPMMNTVIEFSKERFYSIKEMMEKEAKQKIVTNEG